MKQAPASLTRSAHNLKSARHLRVLLLIALAFCVGHSVRAADTLETTWTGTTTAWSTAGNWSGGNGVPSATVSAVFNAPFTNQPTYTGTVTSEGVWVAGSSGTTGNSGLTTITGTTLIIQTGATLDGVSAGILLDGTGNNSLTINSSIRNLTNTNYQVDNSGTLTINGQLVLPSGSTLTLGNTTLDGTSSTINLTGGSTSATGVILVATNGVVNMSGSYTVTSAGLHVSTLSAGTLNFSGAMAQTGSASSGWFVSGGTANFNSLHAMISGTLQTTGAGAVVNESVANAFSGNLAVTSGAGIVNLSQANDYTGGTLAGGGIINIGNNGSLGSGTLTLQGGTISATGSLTLANNVTVNSATAIIGGSNSITFTGTLTQNGAAARTLTVSNTGGTTFGDVALTSSGSGAARVFNLSGTGTTTINGTISDGSFAGSSLTLLAGMILTLNGSNTYTGGTNDAGAGTILLGTNTALGTGTLNLNSGKVGATVDLSGAGNTVGNAVTLSASSAIVGTNNITFSGAFLDNTAGLTLTINNTGTTSFSGGTFNIGTTAGRVLTINGTAGTIVIGDVITPTGTFVNNINFSNSGTLVLTAANLIGGTNTGSAALNVTNGTVVLANKLALQNGALAVNGATLVFDSSVSGHAFQLGGLQGSANVALQDNAGTPNAVALTVGTTQQASTYSGILSGPGSLIKVGAGTEFLSNTNTYSGTTTVLSGVLNLADSGGATVGSVANSDVTIGSAGTNANSSFTATGGANSPATTQRTKSLTFNGSFNTAGANFTDNGVGANNTEDDYGALTLTAGELRSNFVPNAASNLLVKFDSVTRNPGTEFVAGSSSTLGTNSISSQTPNETNIVFTSAPSLIGGGGSAGSNTISVLPWAFVNGGLATYNSTNGLRALNTSTEEIGLSTSNTSTQNVSISGTTVGASTKTLATATSVNALQSLTGTTNLVISLGAGTNGDTTALTVASGAIAVQKSLTIGAVAGNGVLAFGSKEGIVNVSDSQVLIVNSVITGSGGLTIGQDITQSGHTTTTVLAGANTYSGVTTFEGNSPTAEVVQLINSQALQNSTLDYNNYGASFTFGNGSTGGQTAYTFGGLKGAQNITLANNNTTVQAVALTVGGDNDSTTYSGVLSDGTAAGGSVTKVGSGTLTLSGTNTYTGTTSVNAGTLNVAGSLASASAVTVGNNTAVATLSGTGTINGTVATATTGGNVAHVAPGATPGTVGTLTIAGSSFTIGNGTDFDFDLNTAQTAGGTTNDLIAMSGGTLTFSGTNTTFNFNALSSISTSGSYTLISGAGSIASFNPANFVATGTGGLSATFSDNASSLFVTFSPASAPGVAYFNGLGGNLNTAGNFDTSVSGTTAVSLAPGSTTNVFFSANRNGASSASTSAPLAVNSLNFGVGSGTNSGITVSGTSTITITGSAVNGNVAGNGISTTGSGSDTISAPIALAASQTWTVDTGGTLTVSGTVSGGSSALTKAGAGRLILSGSNTYSGGTTLSLGTLVAGSSTTVSGGNLVSGPFGTGLLTLGTGTALDDNGTGITLANAVSASGTITFASTGSGSLTFSGAGLTTSGSFTLTNNTDLYVNNTTTIADNISNGSGFSLNKYGNGTLNLTGTGSNNGTASTTVTNGTISVASGSSLGSGTVTLANGTGLSYNGTTSGTLNQNITVTGTGSVGTISNASGQVLTLTGTLNKNGSTLDISGGRNVISGQIVGSAAHSDVNYIGNSTTGLTSNSTYNGPTTISGTSTLLTGVSNALPNPAPYTDLTLGASSDVASTVNTLDLLGTSQTVASLTSTGTGTNQVISSNGSASTPAIGTGASTGSGNLTVNVASGTNTYTGLLGDSNSGAPGRNANNFGLTKSGTGTLALTNANTYSGGTTITAGTLIVSNLSGSATGSGFLNLSSGATLTGTGTINASGNSNISGKIVVGNGVDATSTMTMTTTGTTNFLSGANLVFNLNVAGNSNELNVGSSSIAFTSGATLTLNLLGSGTTDFLSGTNYALLIGTSSSQYSGLTFGGSFIGGQIINNLSLTLTGTATNGQLNSTYYNRSFLFLTSGGNIDVEVVPEPGTWALMLGGLALLIFFQRARRRN